MCYNKLVAEKYPESGKTVRKHVFEHLDRD
jgi:hypothetical protein